jgi:hypothetical protein
VIGADFQVGVTPRPRDGERLLTALGAARVFARPPVVIDHVGQHPCQARLLIERASERLGLH